MRGRVLLTGGAGFIGSSVLDALVLRGQRVTVVDDLNDYYDPRIKHENVEAAVASGLAQVVHADIRSPQTWAELDADAGWDGVIHLAARAGVRPSIRDPGLYASVNVEGTARVLDWACSGASPIPFVLASSSSVYGDEYPVPFGEDAATLSPVSPYGATKQSCEALTQAWRRMRGLRAVALRFFTVYGPRQRPDLAIHKFARRIEAERPIPVYGDGSSARDYTHIDDIVAGVLAALEAVRADRLEHFAYNLGSDRAIRLDAMIQAIEEAVGKAAIIDRQPDQLGDVKRTWADVSRAGRDLGYAPSVTFEDGLRDFVSWLRR